MKRFRFLLAASVVAGASSVCVHSLQADDDDNQRGDRVARMMNLDKDDDGKISKAETPERLAGLFAKADTDEDGFLTEAEVKNAMAGSEGQANDGQRGRGRGDRAEGGRLGDERGRGPGGEGRGRERGERGERGGERGEQQGRGGERDSDRRPDGPSESVLMGAIDADGNGQLSEEEIKNAVTALRALDRNEDGMLDAVELRASRRSPEGRGGEGRGGEGRGDRGRGGQGPGDRGGEGRGEGRGDQGRGDQGRGREGDRPSPDSFAAMMIERMDKDDDGKLKGDEIPERMAGRLADIDKNDDKAIDKAELAAMAEQMFRGRERGGDRESGSRANGRRPGGDRPQRPDGAGSSEDRGGQRPKRPASDDDIT